MKYILCFSFGFFLFFSSASALTIDGLLEEALGQQDHLAIVDVPAVYSETSAIGKIGILSLLVIRLILYIAGIGAVAMITFAGMRFVVSAGSEEQRTSAKNTLMYAIFGLLAIFLALLVVQNIVRILS